MNTISDTGSNSESQASKSIFSEKLHKLTSGMGHTLTNSVIKAYDRLSDKYFLIGKRIRVTKLILDQYIDAKKSLNHSVWEDNNKKTLKSLMKKNSHDTLSSSVEAGIMGLLAINKEAEVLELGCGDGFEAKNFYVSKAYHLTAMDSDPIAITHASKNNSSPQITYKLCDFTRDMIVGKFDTIIWQRGPEIFTRETALSVLSLIKMRLNSEGILTGSSLISAKDSWALKASDIEKLLSEHFENVKIKESACNPDKFYFFASEKEIRLI